MKTLFTRIQRRLLFFFFTKSQIELLPYERDTTFLHFPSFPLNITGKMRPHGARTQPADKKGIAHLMVMHLLE